MSKINPKLMPFLVGDLFFTTNNTNPANRFGGTWQLYGKGRTIVGYDPDDTDFDTIGKTGGSKYLQQHTHSVNDRATTFSGTGNHAPSQTSGDRSWNNLGVGNVQGVQTGNSGNLQPYITTYIWIKTA